VSAAIEARGVSADRVAHDRAVLEQRAQALARATGSAEPAEDVLHVVTFALAGERYALEAAYVREVLREAQPSRLPWAPAALLGAVNVRGEVLAVADLGHLLGVPAAASPGPVVVLAGPAPPVGLLVDEVEELLALPSGTVAPPPADTAGPAQELLVGVSARAVVLDARALLTDPRLWTEQRQERR
jgi:purine-binding chemotaxis protein CheW